MTRTTPASQATTTLGLRWDAMNNVAVKVQFDHIDIGANLSSRLVSYPGLTPASKVNLVSLAVDFVFQRAANMTKQNSILALALLDGLRRPTSWSSATPRPLR